MSWAIFDRVAHAAALRSHLADPPATDPLPDALVAWLGKLVLLEGVPFDHLVADDALLPAESIRFFTVDRNWQAVLLDGALTIGRLGPADATLDRALLAPASGPGLLDQALAAAGSTAPVLSGFLLRSEAVAGWWPGMRIDGYAAGASDDAPLPVLRLERLAPSLLLALFDGVLDRVVAHEPPQGVHFGLDHPETTDPSGPLLHRTLRYLAPTDDSPAIPAGQTLPASDPNSAFVVEQAAGDTTFVRPNRVVKADRLATGMRGHLIAAGALTADGAFTSAEFALELIEGVDLVTFTTEGAKPS